MTGADRPLWAFDWDLTKDAANERKHGITFDEATTAFDDPHLVNLFDQAHSTDEDRWLALGYSVNQRLLVVSFTIRDPDEHIRLISARLATQPEHRLYHGT